VSDDGCHALTVIGFIGSVFSPYYAWARAKGPAQPEDFCAINVALYSPGAGRWAMTERAAASLTRDRDTLRIGPSALHWRDGQLDIMLDEISVPWLRRIRGSIRLTAEALPDCIVHLDDAGHHRWRPIAPLARVEARFDAPALNWQGHGYFDMNSGDAPLEQAFDHWHWSRARRANEALILYAATRRDGSRFDLALACDRAGRVLERPAPPRQRLPSTLWRLRREVGGDADARPHLVRTLEDSPFYARSLVQGQWDGEALTMMHESLNLVRFRQRLVQAMLPFRMPRRS